MSKHMIYHLSALTIFFNKKYVLLLIRVLRASMRLTGPQIIPPGASPVPTHGLKNSISAQLWCPFVPAWGPWMDSLGWRCYLE